MKKIKCKSNYTARFRDQPVSFVAGFEGFIDDAIAEFIMRDSPDSFELIGAKAPGAPAVDKMISEPLESKTISELKELCRAKGLPVGGKKDVLIARLEEVE